MRGVAPPPTPPLTRIGTSVTDQAFVAAYDAVVCDLDGVVYRGDEAVPGAPETLQRIVASGTPVVYATNNASRVPAEVCEQLSALGAPGTVDDVVTSAQAGAEHIAERLGSGDRVLALGGPGVAEALNGVGLRPVAPSDADGAPVAGVLQGLGRDLTVRDFEHAARLLRGDVLWVATNADATLPLPWGDAPGNGAYVEMLARVVHRSPEVVGKPCAPLYRLAAARLGVDPARTLAVGDRLDTDIAGAREAGTASALVLTGVSTPSDLVASDLSPTVVVRSLNELLGTINAPRRDGDSWVCGSARASLPVHGELDLTVAGEPADAIRAGLALLLQRRDDGHSREELRRLARPLDRLVSG
jgi:glycerol 3-phosphatase-2